MQPYTELKALFTKQSKGIWDRLGYVRDSYKSRGVLGPVRFGEETISDLLMMDLYIKGFTLAHFKQTSKPEESMWGTDFELWLGSRQLGWFRFAVQAKKLDLRTDRYGSLTQDNTNGSQIELLEDYALLNRAAPLYSLYNHTDCANGVDHWHCCTGPINLKELGCSVTPSSNIHIAIDKRGGKNFDSIHKQPSTLPWKCLVSCPKVWHLLEVSSGMSETPILDSMPLFDPSSCYHEAVPEVLRSARESDVVKQNERGGCLISIPVDADGVIDPPADTFEISARREFSERYSRDVGVPKAAAVIEVESSESW